MHVSDHMDTEPYGVEEGYKPDQRRNLLGTTWQEVVDIEMSDGPEGHQHKARIGTGGTIREGSIRHNRLSRPSN